MKMNEILEQIDKFYAHKQYDEAHQYMIQQLQNAMEDQRDDLVLGILNELLGYYRVHGLFDIGVKISQQAYNIVYSLGLSETIDGATTFLNIATLYRAKGDFYEAMDNYLRAKAIYEKTLSETDERLPSLYNNISLLYQEIGHSEKAIEYATLALQFIQKIPNCEIETAITYTNLAQMYMNQDDKEKGQTCLKQAIMLFEKYGPDDPHYFAAMAGMAQFYHLAHDDERALALYEDVLLKIEKTFGRNKDYQTVYQNYQYVKEHMKTNGFGMKLCRDFFEQVGKPMLEKEYHEYLSYMAIGLVGMGSECLGYDDEISRDHDFGPGFCIWLPQKIYQQIGAALQRSYEQLPMTFQGYKRQVSHRGEGRVGVFEINSFYQSYLGLIPASLSDWLCLDEQALLMMTSGVVFEDHYGEFSRIRSLLSYYPEDIRKKKIAKSVAKIAQSGQYNYARCMKRGDIVAAGQALYEFIHYTIACVYLLNHTYCPYYKWNYRGMQNLKKLKSIQPLLKELVLLEDQSKHWENVSSQLNMSDQKVVCIEKICRLIVHELNQQNLSHLQDDFLENHVDSIMNCIQDVSIRNRHIMEG